MAITDKSDNVFNSFQQNNLLNEFRQTYSEVKSLQQKQLFLCVMCYMMFFDNPKANVYKGFLFLSSNFDFFSSPYYINLMTIETYYDPELTIQILKIKIDDVDYINLSNRQFSLIKNLLKSNKLADKLLALTAIAFSNNK